MTRTPYVPPVGDEPMDEIQSALARALAAVIIDEMREEAVAAAREQDQREPGAADAAADRTPA